ncbi:MAG TPA: N-acetylmuramoyl-L-alanine amidase [Xanthobacteraceae bacterium]|nr:N-acetylmuramoyl-L-alanine amidase [Xanthobacteraceae bacterium]
MEPFSPDFAAARVVPSPNFGDRKGGALPDLLILHYTGTKTADEALRHLCNPAAEVSSHYLVFEDGGIAQLVPEARRAWHAGVSSWEGTTDINSRSIGIEIANPGHDFGYPDFPPKQIKAVIALCLDIVLRHRIRADRVLAHSDVAPARKQDPGEKFPWRQLHKAGVGHWVMPSRGGKGAALRANDGGAEVFALQEELAAYGYGISPTGEFDQATAEVVTAFQRHFRPARVDGIADASTRITLQKLLVTRPMVAA